MSLAMPCLDLHVCKHVLCSYAYVYAFTCLYSWICVLPCFYAYTYMLTCISPCLYAQIGIFTCLHRCVLLALCHLSCACMLYILFMCLGLDLVCHAMCYCSPFVSFYRIFLCVSLMIWTRSRPFGLCHRPCTMAHIKRVWIIPICMSMLACFYALCLCQPLQFQALPCLAPSVGLTFPTPMRPFLDVTIWEASLDARFALHDAMLTMLVCATRWLSMHPYTLDHMSMHELCLLVCRPCLNTMKLWTFDPKLHLSLADTTFCLLSCLFACLLASLFVCLLVRLLILLLVISPATCYACFACMLVCFYTHYALSMHLFSFHCLSTSFLSLSLHVHT